MEGFVIRALRPIQSGEHLFINYITVNNALFFLNYMFVEKNNPANELVLHAQLDGDNDHMFKFKKGLLDSVEPKIDGN